MEFGPAVVDFYKNSKRLYPSKQYNNLLSYNFQLQGLEAIELLCKRAASILPF